MFLTAWLVSGFFSMILLTEYFKYKFNTDFFYIEVDHIITSLILGKLLLLLAILYITLDLWSNNL
jgi:hypothetical protein